MPCAYVYIIRCRGGSLYTGIARSVCRRLRQHAEKSPIRGADGVRRQTAPA